MKRLLIAAIALATLTGCTTDEVEAWLEWHAADPIAAEVWVTEHADRISPPAPTRTIWDDLAACESGERWDYNGPSGFDGGLQFAPSTWRAMGGPTAYAWQASRAEQIAVAERLLDVQGWGAWPGCARKLGLR